MLAIAFGLVAPLVTILIAGLLCYPFFPWIAGVAETLLRERAEKGLLVPFVAFLGVPILMGDLGAAVFSWRVLRSKRLASLTLVTAVFAQIGIIAAVIFMILTL